MVEAYDRRFAAGILIPEGEIGDARNGLVVGVEITQGPGAGRWPLGRIVEVLGSPDEPGMDLKTIVRKYDLREEFPPDVLSAASAIPDRVPAREIARREDFRDLPIVTIDGETAKDFDDAVLVRRNDDGTFELQVHIADVAHYVTASGPLDREAYQRGTSVYFPGTAIPMLPEALSNGICSLNPGVERLVQSCLMTIDAHGRVVSNRFAQGVIRSAARMTYTKVAKILVDDDRQLVEEYRDLVPTFRLMEELCGILNAKRRRRGSIDFDLPEPEIILAVTGEMTGIVALERNIAHRLIEEFMLIANETVARHLWRARIPSLYRIHERPDPKKLEEFDTVAQAFGYRLPKPFSSIEPAAFQAIIDMAQGQPEEPFLARLMLRSMKQARYSERREIHFGLASRSYTHFTSPIRRYPDLVVHRLLKTQLSGEPLSGAEKKALSEFLPEAAVRSSQMERNADAAENELIDWKKMAFMAERLGEEFDGFIVSVHAFGFFVELREYFVDGLVAVESLHDDRYRFVERKQLLQGEGRGRVFRLGDKVRVRVDRVNHFMLQLDFSLVEPCLGSGKADAASLPRSSGGRAATRRGTGGRSPGGKGRRVGAARGKRGSARPTRRGRRAK
jgi:ribonuclease R